MRFLLVIIFLLSVGGAYGATGQDAQSKSDGQSSGKTPVTNIMSGGAMGMSGYGAGQYLAGAAEQDADAAAERDMRAYLETFRCDFGQGRNIRGGQTDVELPLSAELAVTYIEYLALATDLQERKNALGLKPGVEADLIQNNAETGLYNNVAGPARGGMFASISRALQDPNGEDAARLAAQLAESKDKAKSGGNMFLGGNALGLAANLFGGKLDNLLSNLGGGKGIGKSGAGDNSISGVFGALTGNGGAGANGTNGVTGNGTVTAGQAASGNAGGEIGRAQVACDTLRSEVSVQAADLHNKIVNVQIDALAAGVPTDAIDAAVKNVEASVKAIGDAQSAADEALSNAQTLKIPKQEECELEFDKDAPVKGEKDEEETDEGFAERQAQYERELNAAKEKQAKCEADNKNKYDKDMQQWQADTKRYADAATRQLQIARTELGKIQSALSNAESAKSRGVAAKQAAADKEAAEQKQEEEKKLAISQQADLVIAAAGAARRHHDAARNLSQDADREAQFDADKEATAEDQINALKESIAEDLAAAKTAADNAEKQIRTAQSASSVDAAKNAVKEAERYASAAEERKKSIETVLQKIKDAKATARKKYAQEQAATKEDSDESDENADDGED